MTCQNLQEVLDRAQPGDIIELEAGATFVGPFTLRNKTGDAWITIRTSAADSQLPEEGQRISPAYAPVLPKIVSPGSGEPALQTDVSAHHYRFIGVEFRPLNADAFIFDLILLGKHTSEQDTLAKAPHHLVLDRCYVHAFPTQGLKRGIALNSAHTDILNSHISGFKQTGQEAQAIAGFNGPGPFRIINNYVEGAGENVMFGGAPPAIPNLIPTGIEVRHNHFFKPLSWRIDDPSYAGIPWVVKNLFELKNARNVIIDGNVFENNWVMGQAGFGIVFTPRPNDSGPAAVVEDVTFTNNILKNSDNGVNHIGIDDIFCSQQPDCGGVRLRRLRIANNIFRNLGAFGGRGHFMQVLSGTDSVTIDHNTAIHTGTGLVSDGAPNTNFVFTNNLFRRNELGVHGSGSGEGIPTLNTFFPGAVFRRNLIHGVETVDGINCSRPDKIGCYPPDNFYPPNLNQGPTFEGLFFNFATQNLRLASGSPYRGAGTDGQDVGANLDAVRAAINPIDDPRTFVRQQYLDFLRREPDPSGWDFWTNEITMCGPNQDCIDHKRENVSAAFFLSIEFQGTGYYVHRLYKASFARMPRLEEFTPDQETIAQGVIVGQPGWEALLESNKNAFTNQWVQRPAFRNTYDFMSNAQYVDTLFANTGVGPQPERDALINGLNNGTETRASVLRKVAENQAVAAAERNRAFVLMQYFGYLRRNPDDAPDFNMDGYNFWLNKLNQFNGDFGAAEMVKAFIVSVEYRSRFGQP